MTFDQASSGHIFATLSATEPSATTEPIGVPSAVKTAGFRREKWLGDFDFDANPNIKPATIHTMATKLVNELVEAADRRAED